MKEKEKEEKEEEEYGLEDADLGLFDAGVCHKYAPGSVFLASVKTGKSRHKIIYFFGEKYEV